MKTRMIFVCNVRDTIILTNYINVIKIYKFDIDFIRMTLEAGVLSHIDNLILWAINQNLIDVLSLI